jgi:two-component system CheB/CheR fusion protein
MQQLEMELDQLKAQQRQTAEHHEQSTEELKASNEELHAINEELRSATEELETSREELYSVNEELRTVNQELKTRVEEVGRTNNDLQNLMASTNIATIFLDQELLIKRYTPSALSLFSLIPTDLGRPIFDLRHRLEYDSLIADASRCSINLSSSSERCEASTTVGISHGCSLTAPPKARSLGWC